MRPAVGPERVDRPIRSLRFVDLPPGSLAATVMVGYDGHRGWLNELAVDPALQGTGVGRRLVDDAEARLLALGCPKVNLMVRSTNGGAVDFYRSLGYAVDDVVALGKRLIRDE